MPSQQGCLERLHANTPLLKAAGTDMSVAPAIVPGSGTKQADFTLFSPPVRPVSPPVLSTPAAVDTVDNQPSTSQSQLPLTTTAAPQPLVEVDQSLVLAPVNCVHMLEPVTDDEFFDAAERADAGDGDAHARADFQKIYNIWRRTVADSFENDGIGDVDLRQMAASRLRTYKETWGEAEREATRLAAEEAARDAAEVARLAAESDARRRGEEMQRRQVRQAKQRKAELDSQLLEFARRPPPPTPAPAVDRCMSCAASGYGCSGACCNTVRQYGALSWSKAPCPAPLCRSPPPAPPPCTVPVVPVTVGSS